MKLTKNLRWAIIRDVLDHVNAPNYEELRNKIQAAIVPEMSPEGQAIYARTPKALATYYISALDYLPRGGSSKPAFVIYGDAPVTSLRDIEKALGEPAYTYRDFERLLTNTVMACSTTGQLAKQLPEIAAYIPNEKPKTKNLPAVTGFSEALQQLGWKQPRNEGSRDDQV